MVDTNDMFTIDWVRQEFGAWQYCPICRSAELPRVSADAEGNGRNARLLYCLHWQAAMDRAEAEYEARRDVHDDPPTGDSPLPLENLWRASP